MTTDLAAFVRESNRIEGIVRDPLSNELQATEDLIGAEKLTILHVKLFVAACQPNARIRDRAGLNVRVGAHIPPPGCARIVEVLQMILDEANADHDPYEVHCNYETLHPFTDGNGRSGRAIWLWQMLRAGGAPLGFLHHWYYQTLQHSRSDYSDSASNVEIPK